MSQIRRYKDLSKKVTTKLKGRSVRNFYKGQSLPRVAYKGARFTVRKGPRKTYELVKHQRLSGMSPHLSFPNGLISGVARRRIEFWYKEHAKKVSIVIPSYNDYELLKACVASLASTIPEDLYNLYIVDDFCTPESHNYLKEFEANTVQVIYRKQNGGFGKAVNTGFKEAISKHPNQDVILLNSDIVAHDGWLAALQYGAYEHHKDVGIVGPKLLYPDGRIQSGGSYRNTEAPEWFDHYYRFQPRDYGPANVPQFCIGVTGACMYIKASLIKKIGMLDEKFPFAFEDADYCLRAWQLGIRTLYYPASELTHHESASRPKNKTLKPKEVASIKIFWDKWGDWFDKRNVLDANGKPRVIYVLQTTGVSGGIRIVFEHLNRLKAAGYSVELWALDTHPNWVELNVETKTFKNYNTLLKALSNEEAIKVATWWETALPVWLASVNKGIPVYFVQEIESWFYPNDPEAQRSVIACYRKEFRNMTTSKYNLDEIRSLGLNATAVPCGYDTDVFHELKDVTRETDTLLAVGRTFFQKNFKQTFEAWKSLGEKRPRLQLFGSEPQMAKMDERITYVTRPSDSGVNKLYNQATVFVQTSYHEGFCLPVLEAMAAGCPVVCTDSHGNRDFCVQDSNCLMVDHDDSDALKTQIDRLFSNPVLRESLAQQGLQTVKSYTWPVVMRKVEAFYNEVAAQKNADYIHKTIKKLSV
jgi:GT2 family glycosyltransferase